MPQAKVSKQPAQREATAAAPTFLPPLHHRQKSLAVREFLGRSRGSQPLYKQPACRDSVRLHCSQAVRRNNFAVLACLQRSQAVAESLPEACQAAIWQLKFNLTHNEDLRRIKACGREPPRSVLRISCLIEHRANVSERACRSYLRRLEPLVFADYRLVERFIGACKADVVRTGCGRLEPRTNAVSASLPTSQGRTVACLGQKVAVVSHQCRLQLLRLAELQTSDYHNDRPLFYACRDDRERLCGAVSSGGGRVLACLNRQREAARPACQVELARVRGLAALDFAVYRRFADACGADLHRLGCVAPGGEPAGSAAALLCLESSLISKGTTAVTAACQTRMMDVRSDFISDPQLLPGLASGCSRELQRCRADHTAEQGLLHCIMRQLRAARDAQLTDGPGRNSTSVCERAVDRVLRVAMPTRDLRVDPVVMSGCAGEVRLHCSAPGTASVYTCLKSRLAAQPETVSVACSNRLAELVYFENRDFRLNARLFKACRAVAAARCGAGETWWSGARDKAAAVALGATFNCLYGLMIRNETSVACSAQLAKSLRERADRARLDARLFAPCLRDLSRLCLHSKRPGDEFTCLQDNLSLLDRTCARVVRQVSERVDSDIELSPDLLFVHSCQPFVRKFCDRVQGQVGLDKTVMSCLIQLKAHPKMDPRCRAGVEHHQLVSLRDYHISRDFASACGDDIRRLCSAAEGADAAGEPSSRRNIDKTVVVRCLATAARDDVLKSRPQRLSRKCQGQLSLELLQRHRLPSLDPRLAKSCELELRTLCPLARTAADGSPAFEPPPPPMLPRSPPTAAPRSSSRTRLMASCQRMIARHCSDRVSRPVQLYTCLRSRMHHASFDAGCFAVGAVTRCLRDIVASEDDADQAAAVGRPAPPSKSSVLRGQCRSYLRSL
uniref:Golgi apparatus protein 1 n=1 Tax=Macrostomum lignano TaxID=282301 RepID=A0A1I8HF93_9PLAT